MTMGTPGRLHAAGRSLWLFKVVTRVYTIIKLDPSGHLRLDQRKHTVFWSLNSRDKIGPSAFR